MPEISVQSLQNNQNKKKLSRLKTKFSSSFLERISRLTVRYETSCELFNHNSDRFTRIW